MSFKDISYMEPLRPFVQQSGTISAILIKGHYEEQCVIILNLDQWFRRECH